MDPTKVLPWEPVDITCGRCRHVVHGARTQPGDSYPATSGYYPTTPGSGWDFAANPGEDALCDACMQHDPRYIARYAAPPVQEDSTP